MTSSSELSDTDVSDQYCSASSCEESSASGPEMSDLEASGGVLSKSVPARERAPKKKKASKVPGVVYLSRIPPYMKPHKLKYLLSPYGKVGNIFLQPEGKLKMPMQLLYSLGLFSYALWYCTTLWCEDGYVSFLQGNILRNGNYFSG